ncbi:MAG: hypothetical protein [Circular genetic element sp.]|nr:MAG: hypothetical protein [Circular genetic element sp.]
MVLSCDSDLTKSHIKAALMGKGPDGNLRGYGGYTDCVAVKSLRPAVQARLHRLGRSTGKGVATYLAGYINKALGVFRPYKSDHYGRVAVDRFSDVNLLAEEHSGIFRASLAPDYPVLHASGRYIPRTLAKALWRRVHRHAYEAFNGSGSFQTVEKHEQMERDQRARFRRAVARHDLRYPPQKEKPDMSQSREEIRARRIEQEMVPPDGSLPPAVTALSACPLLHGERLQLDGIIHRLSAALGEDDPVAYQSAWAEFLKFRARTSDISVDYAAHGLRPAGMPHDEWAKQKPPPSPEAVQDETKSVAWLKNTAVTCIGELALGTSSTITRKETGDG